MILVASFIGKKNDVFEDIIREYLVFVAIHGFFKIEERLRWWLWPIQLSHVKRCLFDFTQKFDLGRGLSLTLDWLKICVTFRVLCQARLAASLVIKILHIGRFVLLILID